MFTVVGEGYHTIYLRAVDQDNNVDCTPAEFSFTIVKKDDHDDRIDHKNIYKEINRESDEIQDMIDDTERDLKNKIEDSENDVQDTIKDSEKDIKNKVEDSNNGVIKQFNALWDLIVDLVHELITGKTDKK
jgi:hypothetical protein